jgi:Flp pilus assembly protein TadG
MTRLLDFWQDRKGVTAVLMSVALVPIVGTLAISTDYSKVMKQKYALQQVVDSTATSLAKDTDILLLSPAQLQTRALGYANAVTGSAPVQSLNLAVTADSERIHIDASGSVKLTFAKIFGTENLVVKVGVTVERAKTKNIEIALALDNTGSMSSSGKITQLKAAVKALVDYMNDKTKNPGNTKIALVPFTTNVKTDRNWMLDSYMDTKPPSNWDGCVTDRNQPNDITDASPTSGNTGTLYSWGTEKSVKVHGKWQTQMVANDCGSLAKIIPLTSDLAKIKTAADTMIADGMTNVPIGVAWAWHALSASQPLNQGSPDGTTDLLRVMIVLTDGENTANRWGNNNGNAIDNRLTAVCNNVKATGIIVYTVRVIDGDANLLKACATTPTHYYNVTNAAQMTPVFEQIASSLSRLRISH